MSSKDGIPMSTFVKRAISHEAGHIIVAWYFGITVECVRVTKGMPNTVVRDLDSPQVMASERFIYLAGGIAGEQFTFGDYETTAMGGDQREIYERKGEQIASYLPYALRIIESQNPNYQRVREQLSLGWITAQNEAKFEDDTDSFDLLSRSELEQILPKRQIESQIASNSSVRNESEDTRQDSRVPINILSRQSMPSVRCLGTTTESVKKVSTSSPLSGRPAGRPAAFPHIPGFKSPVEVDQERKDAKTFWPRMVFVLLIGSALGAILSGLLGIFTASGVAAVCGLCCIVLTMVVIKEVQ
jgi:hypothetical protein